MFVENYLGKPGCIWNAFTALLKENSMALWEYKVISSGKGGFATPALLENFLNQLGKDEWEIIEFHTQPDNALAFQGLARRPTQRDWTLEAAVAAAAKVEADKIRAELMARQHAGDLQAGTGDGQAANRSGTERAAADGEVNGLRQLRDTDLDHDPEALADEAAGLNEWDNLDTEEDDLPNFFDALKPHLRKNQRGPGMSVAIDYLAKRWEQPERDLVGALEECGFVLPEGEDSEPVYLEFEGDLYWLNRNNRGQLFLNTREKPRPRFRIATATRLDPADPSVAAIAEEHAAEVAERARRAQEQAEREAEAAARRAERETARQAAETARREQQEALQAAQQAAQQSAAEGLPGSETLLEILQPFLRRNRRGPGSSGSTHFLAKALHKSEADLVAVLAALGLTAPARSGDKPVFTEIGNNLWWINKDSRGGLWINTREKRERPSAPAAPANDVASAPDAKGAATDETDAGTDADHSEESSSLRNGTEEPAATVSASPESQTPEPAAAATVPESSEAGSTDTPPAPAGSDAEPATTPAVADTADPDDAALSGTPAPDEAADAATDADDADQEEETAASDAGGAEGESAGEPEPGPDTPEAVPASPGAPSPLTALRLLLKPNRRGTGVSGEVGFLARSLGKSEPELLAALGEAGLVVPDDPEAKPVFVEHGAEIFWFNRNAKDETLWLNAKASRASSSARRTGTGGKSGGSGGSRSRRPAKKSGPEEPAA
ncbi:hypothetical protein OPIT5_07340 [Opitutaceae bacterium TAV5]|nr:hypothetical protein OPIT5_07340 [Opitutaceae bacterium TAV5]